MWQNSISLEKIFQFYKINLFGNKCVCPFYHHKMGKERTPSFVYYKDSNSFYCFGCKTSGGPIQFIENIESCDRSTAQYILQNNFDSSYDSSKNEFYQTANNELLFEFANFCREKIKDGLPLEKVEKYTHVLDNMFIKHKNLNKQSLKFILDSLKKTING